MVDEVNGQVRSSPDEVLLTRARAGDASALEPLLEIWEPRIYRFGLRMCGDEETAREVLQDTLLAAFRGLGGFRGEAQLSTWLYSLARSFCIRQRRRREGDSLDSPEVRARADEGLPPDDAAHARELGQLLQAGLLSLREDQREVVVLKDVEGLTVEEIAQVLREEVPAVKSRLHRGRLALRDRLKAVLEPVGGIAPCAELSAELAAFAGRDIDQSACRAIEAHLARCERCKSAGETIEHSLSLCQRLPGGEVPGPVKAAVRRLLLAG